MVAAERLAISRAPGESQHDKWHELSRKIGLILNGPDRGIGCMAVIGLLGINF